jgi:HEAT repeat protein
MLTRMAAVVCGLALVLPLSAAPGDKDKEKDKEKELATKSLDKLLRECKSIDPATRDAAVRGIAQFGHDGKTAIPILLPLLADLDPGVSANALAALRAVASDKELKAEKTIIPTLQKMLQFGTPSGKANAAMALGAIGANADTKPAIKILVEYTLKSTSWEVRKAGAFALGSLAYEKKGGPEMSTVNALAKLVYDDRCAQVRLQALQAFATLGAHRTEAESSNHVVKHALDYAVRQNRDASEVVWAHTLLSQTVGTKPDTHMTTIIAVIQNTNAEPTVRANAIIAAGAMCSVPKDVLAKDFPKPVVDRLFDQMIFALRDRDDNIAGAACRALATSKENLTKKHIATIAGYLAGDKLSYARVHAAQALGVLGERSVTYIGALTEALSDRDLDVAGAAAQALGSLGRQKLLKAGEMQTIAAILNDPKAARQGRAHAAGTIGLIGDNAEAHIPDLLAALPDPDDLVAASASQALVAMRYNLKDAQVASIAALLTHKEPVVRARAVQILGALDDKGKVALPDIIKALQDKDPGVVKNVIAVLAQMGQSFEHLNAVETALTPMLEHPDKDVQLTANQALGAIGKFRQAFTKP